MMNTEAVLQYANEALYGLASIRFEGWTGMNISYQQFVGQVSADYNTGKAFLDVYKLGPVGRIDGQPIPALLPPGSSEA
jgi:hypothetical protein